MYKTVRPQVSKLSKNDSTEGFRIEQKIERMINNKERIDGEAPLIFTEKSEGVKAGYNIRSDRFDIALEGIEKIQKSKIARRENEAKLSIVKDGENDAEQQSTQGTQEK